MVPKGQDVEGRDDRGLREMVPHGEGTAEDEKMSVEVRSVSVEKGRVYRFHRGGRYSPVGISRHCHTGQRTVVYESLEPEDRGELYNAPMVDWALKFRLEEAVVLRPAERTIDLVTEKLGDAG